MSLLDYNFFIIDYYGDIRNKQDQQIGRCGIGGKPAERLGYPFAEIYDSDGSVFISFVPIRNIFWIKGYDVKDSNGSVIARVSGNTLKNSNGEKVLSTKRRKTIKDKEGNVVAEIAGISWGFNLPKTDRPWEITIHNKNFDRLMLLGLIFAIYMDASTMDRSSGS